MALMGIKNPYTYAWKEWTVVLNSENTIGDIDGYTSIKWGCMTAVDYIYLL